METKLDAIKQPMGKQRKEKGNKKIPWDIKMETQHSKIYGTQLKQPWEGSPQKHRPASGNKKIWNKQSNSTPKKTRKIKTNKAQRY